MTTTPSPAIYCRRCNYDLRATPPDSPRCPECGRPFNPANPKTFRCRPLRRWLRHVKRTAYALLSLTLILAAIWLWLFWGWYDEQQALKAIHAVGMEAEPLSPWLRDHGGPPGFVLDRVNTVQVYADVTPVELAPLGRLKRLRLLVLDGAGITDLSTLETCTSLKALLLRNTGAIDLAPLAKVATLEVLLVPRGITDLTPLPRLTNLTYLAFGPSSGEIDLLPLAGLTKLESITLEGTHVTNPRPLARFKSLRWVSLPEATTTEEQAGELRRALPGCEIVRQ